MADKLSVDDVEGALQTLRTLSSAVDELVRKRAAEGPFTLPPPFDLAPPGDDEEPPGDGQQRRQPQGLTPADLRGKQPPNPLPNALTRTQGPLGLDSEPPYPHALAAAAKVAHLTTADAAVQRGKLQAPAGAASKQRPLQGYGALARTGSSTGGSTPVGSGTVTPGAAQAALAAGAQALLALPGQLPYRKLLAAAKRSRAPESQAFAQELDGMDEEIDAFLASDRYHRLAADAATVLQTAWRARGPRLLFRRYAQQQRQGQLRIVAEYLGPWRQVVEAARHQRKRSQRTVFREWRALVDLKTELFNKVLVKLKASMIDVRDSQSPNHLWRLCTAPGEDPWTTKIGLGNLCRNLILAQYPRRKMKACFQSWRQAVLQVRAARDKAAAVLSRMELGRTMDRLHTAFRFWYRWSMVKLSERLMISPPLFRPQLEVWDRWLWEHMRSRELHTRIAQLHRGFRMRHCFQFWHGFAARNRKLRQAWMGAAVPQIEALMRYAMGCLKANWIVSRSQRRLRNSAFLAWLRIAQRNVLVRKIARQAEALSRLAIQKLHFRRMREWCNMSRLLNTAATLQMLQRRPLCTVAMCAWTGDDTHMWFVAAWHAWRSLAVGRMRMRCWLGAHVQTAPHRQLELCFKAWRKVALLQAEHTAWVQERRAQREARAAERAARELALADAVSRPGSRHLCADDAPAPGTPPYAASLGALSARSAVSRVASAASQRASPNEGLAAHDDDDDGEELEEELADGSVEVHVGDFPAPAQWRALVPAAAVLQLNDEQTSGVNPSLITQRVEQLFHVEGRFKPEDKDDDTQLVLEVCSREEVTPYNRHMLSEDATHQTDLWLEGVGGPDPYLWQRVVGLALCNAQLHPEAPCGPLVDHQALPWAVEVNRVRLRQAAARMRLSGLDPGSRATSQTGDDEDGGRPATGRLSPGGVDDAGSESGSPRLGSRIAALREWEVGGLSAGAAAEAGPLAVHLRLKPEQQELMWLHRLALAEELLEGAVGRLLQVGYHELPTVYDHALRLAPKSPNLKLNQGDLLVHLLKNAVSHDTIFMAAANQYRANRDRVITMGMSLHKHAMALNSHCPEFTLTYPSYNPAGTWQEAMSRVDQEDPDAPPPPVVKPLPAPAEQPPQELTANQRLLLSTGLALGINTSNPPSPPKTQGKGGAWRPGGALGSKSAALSTSERIKMEMMGLSPPPSAPASSPGLPLTGTTVQSPNGGSSPPRASTPPRAATPPTALPTKPSTAALTAKTSTAAPQPQQPPAASRTPSPPPQKPADGAGPTAGPTAGQPPAGPKPLSLEDVQSKGVVLGAAAAAILAAKAAAAKRAVAGHRANQAEVVQLLQKATPYKAAWRPSGYRKKEVVEKDKEPRPPKIKRLPPLPQLRPASPEKKGGSDEFSTGVPSLGAGASGMAAGDAALRAMMMAQQQHAQHALQLQVGMPMSPGLGPRSPARALMAAGFMQVVALAQHQAQAMAMQQQAPATPAAARPRALTPPPPYKWFDAEGRLFHTVADIPQPPETPSMHELHHRANRLNSERLETSLFTLPLLPAIVFTDWGNPIPPHARSPHSHARMARGGAATASASGAPDSPAHGASAPLAEAGAAEASPRGSAAGKAAAPAPPHRLSNLGGAGAAAAAATAPEGRRVALVDVREEEEEEGEGKAQELIRKLDLTGLLKPEEDDQQPSYRHNLGEQLMATPMKTAMRRVSDVGATTQYIDEDAVDQAVAEHEIESAQASARGARHQEANADVTPRTLKRALDEPAGAQGSKAASTKSPTRHRGTFQVTPDQLNIFLGGHMRRTPRQGNNESKRVRERQLLRDTAPTPHAMVPDAEFETRFDPERVVATPRTQQGEMLEGYDLRAELRDLMGSETAAAVLAGAEAALLGNRQLSNDEQEAIRLELERLELELAKGNRQRRRGSPTRHFHSPGHLTSRAQSRLSGELSARLHSDTAGSSPGSPKAHWGTTAARAPGSRGSASPSRSRPDTSTSARHAQQHAATPPHPLHRGTLAAAPAQLCASRLGAEDPAAAAAAPAQHSGRAGGAGSALRASQAASSATQLLASQSSLARRTDAAAAALPPSALAGGRAAAAGASSPPRHGSPVKFAADPPAGAQPGGTAAAAAVQRSGGDARHASVSSVAASPTPGQAAAAAAANAGSASPRQGSPRQRSGSQGATAGDAAAQAQAIGEQPRPSSVSPWAGDEPAAPEEAQANQEALQLLRSSTTSRGAANASPSLAAAGAAAAGGSGRVSSAALALAAAAGPNGLVQATQLPHMRSTNSSRQVRRALRFERSCSAKVFPSSRALREEDEEAIFPDRPSTADSATGGIYAESMASSMAHEAYGAGRDDLGVQVSSFANMFGGALPEGPDGDQATAASLFATGTGRRQRRKSNLRTRAAAAAAAHASLGPNAMQTPSLAHPLEHGDGDEGGAAARAPWDFAGLGSVPEDVDEETLAELEALRSMWCSAPYTLGAEAGALPAPDSEPAAAITQILQDAADDDWQRYEASAGQLVEQLTAVLSQREALDRTAPMPLGGGAGGAGGAGAAGADRPGSTAAAAGAAASLAGVGRHGLASAAGATKGGPHQLQRALSLMEDSIAAAIDPDRLTGLNVSKYPDALGDLVGRLVVAPMATRYLFWKKVQSINQLRQRIMEDRALEEQLRALSWATSFAPGHTTLPSGAVPPRAADAHAAAAPPAASTGAPAGLLKPAGWSSGALALATAPREPWATPIPGELLRPQPAVMPISQPITLRPRDDTPAGAPAWGASVRAPVVGDGPDVLPRAASRDGERREEEPWAVPPLPLRTAGLGAEARDVRLGDQDVEEGDGRRTGGRFFSLQGQELLAAKLTALLEVRRQTKMRADLAGPTPRTAGSFRHGGPDQSELGTARSEGEPPPGSIEALERDEAQVDALADMTIALHRDTLARHHRRVGHASSTLLQGKGHAAGWAPPAPLPPGYNGRDSYMDTTDPYTHPTRAAATARNGAPPSLPSVTLKGAAIASVTAKRADAERIAAGVAGSGLSMAIAAAAPPPQLSHVVGARNLPAPYAQARPLSRVYPPLAPVAPTPAYPASERQLGNVLFVTPHERAAVTLDTRLVDNAFVPGPHALGPDQGLVAAGGGASGWSGNGGSVSAHRGGWAGLRKATHSGAGGSSNGAAAAAAAAAAAEEAELAEWAQGSPWTPDPSTSRRSTPMGAARRNASRGGGAAGADAGPGVSNLGGAVAAEKEEAEGGGGQRPSGGRGRGGDAATSLPPLSAGSAAAAATAALSSSRPMSGGTSQRV